MDKTPQRIAEALHFLFLSHKQVAEGVTNVISDEFYCSEGILQEQSSKRLHNMAGTSNSLLSPIN